MTACCHIPFIQPYFEGLSSLALFALFCGNLADDAWNIGVVNHTVEVLCTFADGKQGNESS